MSKTLGKAQEKLVSYLYVFPFSSLNPQTKRSFTRINNTYNRSVGLATCNDFGKKEKIQWVRKMQIWLNTLDDNIVYSLTSPKI